MIGVHTKILHTFLKPLSLEKDLTKYNKELAKDYHTQGYIVNILVEAKAEICFVQKKTANGVRGIILRFSAPGAYPQIYV
jgi:hypothetical protein